MHKVISSSRNSDDLSISYHRSNEISEKKLNNNETTKGNYHVRNYLKDIFGFAEHQDSCTYDLGYKLTLQRNNDNHVLGHPVQTNDAVNVALARRVIIDDISHVLGHPLQTNGAVNVALADRVFIDDIGLYVQHYIPSISNQKLMLGPIVSKTPTELSFTKRSSYRKDVTTEKKLDLQARRKRLYWYTHLCNTSFHAKRSI